MIPAFRLLKVMCRLLLSSMNSMVIFLRPAFFSLSGESGESGLLLTIIVVLLPFSTFVFADAVLLSDVLAIDVDVIKEEFCRKFQTYDKKTNDRLIGG